MEYEVSAVSISQSQIEMEFFPHSNLAILIYTNPTKAPTSIRLLKKVQQALLTIVERLNGEL